VDDEVMGVLKVIVRAVFPFIDINFANGAWVRIEESRKISGLVH
jgi:hypothetical protein